MRAGGLWGGAGARASCHRRSGEPVSLWVKLQGQTDSSSCYRIHTETMEHMFGCSWSQKNTQKYTHLPFVWQKQAADEAADEAPASWLIFFQRNWWWRLTPASVSSAVVPLWFGLSRGQESRRELSVWFLQFLLGPNSGPTQKCRITAFRLVCDCRFHWVWLCTGITNRNCGWLSAGTFSICIVW